MSTRYSSANGADAIKVWWELTRTKLDLFLDVMRDGGKIGDSEIHDALTYLTVRTEEFAQASYPPHAIDIHRQLLDALQNIKQSLHYRAEHNLFQAQSRLDMANANMDAVRFRLIQFNIMI